MRRNLAMTVALATLGVGAGGEVLPAAPRPKDEKPQRRQRSTMYGGYGIPYPGLKHVSRESMNLPPSTPSGANLARGPKRKTRKARMRLRKRRGWR